MTHHILTTDNYLKDSISHVLRSISKFFRNVLEGIMEARQLQANYEIAKLLQKEFPNESIDYIFQQVNEGKIHEKFSK